MDEHASSLKNAIIENLRHLSGDKQQEVLDFVQFLRQRTVAPRPRQSVKGLWAGVQITGDDIAAMRREMWSEFPRDA